MLAGSRKHQTADPNKEAHKAAEPAKAENLKAEGSAQEAPKTWYFDLDPVVANLDEPGVTRYIRVTLTLEVDQEIDKKKGEEFLKEQKPILTNWLAIYLAGLGLDDIRGNKNHMRIQSQILDAFNEKLFREQLSYFNDLDLTEKIDFAPGFEIADIEIENTLSSISMEQSI